MVDGRRVAIGFGIAAVLGCLAFGGYHAYGWFTNAVSAMKATGEPALTALADKDWDAAALLPFATDALRGQLQAGDAKAVFKDYRTLGKVKRFLGVQNFNQSYANTRWTARFDERVEFEGGTTQVRILLDWVEGNWKLNGVLIDRPARSAPQGQDSTWYACTEVLAG